MYIINPSRHAFSRMVGSGLRAQDLLGDDMIIFLILAAVTMRVENLVADNQRLQYLEYDL